MLTDNLETWVEATVNKPNTVFPHKLVKLFDHFMTTQRVGKLEAKSLVLSGNIHQIAQEVAERIDRKKAILFEILEVDSLYGMKDIKVRFATSQTDL